MKKIEVSRDMSRIHNIKSDGKKCTFIIRADKRSGIANAIRRSLLNDVTTYAPKSICIQKNTSCQTDEYIAHRVGLIPFDYPKNVTIEDIPHLSCSVTGSTAFSKDLVGDFFRATQNVPIMKLDNGQELSFTIEFERGTGAKHAKFSHISAVEFKKINDVGKTDADTQISFSMITQADPLLYSLDAIQSLLKHVETVLYFIDTEYDATVEKN